MLLPVHSISLQTCFNQTSWTNVRIISVCLKFQMYNLEKMQPSMYLPAGLIVYSLDHLWKTEKKVMNAFTTVTVVSEAY